MEPHRALRPSPDTQTISPPEYLFRTVTEVAKRLKPEAPVQCVFPQAVRDQAQRFIELFPGTVLYAVKCNPGADVLRHMYAAGIRHFDVASLDEARLIKGLFKDAKLHFMHPVKSRESIRRAYRMGIRDFALDSAAELMKLMEETKSARDLRLFVRLAVAGNAAAYDLSGKFGAAPSVAADLLRHCRKVAAKVGICFHVGSQCMDPAAYVGAIGRAADVVAKAKVKLDILDVGGGFPAVYPNMTPPPLEAFMDAIKAAAQPFIEQGTELWCEPGRAMVAAGASILARVTLRKGRRLYLNDGTYGSLFDAGALGWRFPVRLVRPHKGGKGNTHKDAGAKPPSEKMVPFMFYGPTCDNLDKMKGPFLLPEDTQEGDWIEIGMLGAYGATMQTRFNGFHSEMVATVWPEAAPFAFERAKKSNVVTLRPDPGVTPASALRRAGSPKPAPAAQPQPQPSLSASSPEPQDASEASQTLHAAGDGVSPGLSAK
ncbi:MAG: type III PLP-dependent enzyme [Rhodospirillaceae bacterium]|nr:type III PLP-dependent enzyme [Rhodospirillaceae bacterium]